ncbi:hypothetical protein ATANTOWER_016217 [Ataeniobius toweri]|uniref:Uncharacterized protein n=1 Tax=Ataeniobius toweri TaxID=208326 RepID=A0ABU7BQD6_9TELE|nr:hypothetical protein [Ataeniobius toweri]
MYFLVTFVVSLSDHRQLAHYLSLLCFLLTIMTLLQTLCLVQITLTSQSQSTLQENKLRELTNRLEKLKQSHHLLFTQYPALNEYCPTSNSSTGGCDQQVQPPQPKLIKAHQEELQEELVP